MPRSLNEPVGFKPSHLIHTRQSIRSLNRGAKTSGVEPSPRLITGVASLTGKKLLYLGMTPRAADTAASTAQDCFDSFSMRRHVSCRNALQKARARFRLTLFYAGIVQKRKTAPANYS